MTAPFRWSGKTRAWTGNTVPPRRRGSSRRKWASNPPGEASTPPSPKHRASSPDRRLVGLSRRDPGGIAESSFHIPDSKDKFTSRFRRGLLRVRDDDQLDRRRAFFGPSGLGLADRVE